MSNMPLKSIHISEESFLKNFKTIDETKEQKRTQK